MTVAEAPVAVALRDGSTVRGRTDEQADPDRRQRL